MQKQKNRLLHLIQMIILYLALLVPMLSCAFLYTISRQVLIERTCQADVKALKQVYSASGSMKQMIGTISWQVYHDQLVAYLLYADYFDSNKLCVAIAQLNNYRSSNPFVDSIYVYNKNLNSISVSSPKFGTYDAPLEGKNAFFDSEIVQLIRMDTTDIGTQPIPRKVIYGDDSYYYYTSMTRGFAGDNQESAVIVNFSQNWLDGVLQNSADALESTLILDRKGTVVNGIAPFEMLDDLSGYPFYLEMKDFSGSGYFMTDVNGEKTLISYLRPEGESWQYLRLTPYKMIVQEINHAIRSFLLAGAFLVAAGITVSFFATRKVKKPIHEIYQNIEQLEQETRENTRGHHEHLLQNLMYGSENSSSSSGINLRKKLHVLEDSDRQCTLILIWIRNYSGLYQNYDGNDRSLLRYALLNIASEISSEKFYVESVDMGGSNHLALILTSKERNVVQSVELVPILAEITKNVEEALSLHISYTVSDAFNFNDIASAYRLTREAAAHQLFCTDGDVLWGRDVLKQNTRNYVYPQEKEEQMIEAVLSCNEDMACVLVRQIILETRDYSFSVVSLAVSRVTLSMMSVLEDLKNSHMLTLDDNIPIWLYPATHLAEAESIESVIDSFMTLIRWICMSLGDKRNAKHTELIRRITDIIGETYTDPMCCLDSVAEAVELSPAYVGRLYKRYTLKSVAETIAELRMNEARRMLLENKKLTVSEIAVRTGFSSNSYFSKAFRKENGMTPNEYRSMNSDKRKE